MRITTTTSPGARFQVYHVTELPADATAGDVLAHPEIPRRGSEGVRAVHVVMKPEGAAEVTVVFRPPLSPPPQSFIPPHPATQHSGELPWITLSQG